MDLYTRWLLLLISGILEARKAKDADTLIHNIYIKK